MLKQIQKEILLHSHPIKAKALQHFFKTGKGEYGEGDRFLGITVPIQRSIAIKFKNLPHSDISELIKSEFHEQRLIALLILIEQSKKANEKTLKQYVDFYLKNTKYINNWDLVDLSAYQIVGKYLLKKDKKILYKLAKSKNIWERRIAIISCFAFIRVNSFEDAIKIANKKHDLIAVHVFDERETELPDVGLIRVRNAETNRLLWVDSSSLNTRRKYNQWYEKHGAWLNDTFLRCGVDVARIRTDQDYIKPLMSLFKKRSARR